MFLPAHDGHGNEARGEFQRRGDGLLEARGDALLDEQAVDDNFNGVVFAFVDDRQVVERK